MVKGVSRNTRGKTVREKVGAGSYCVFEKVGLADDVDVVLRKCKATVCSYHSSVQEIVHLQDHQRTSVCFSKPMRERLEGLMNPLPEVVLDGT